MSSHQRANCSNIDWHQLISTAWFSRAFNCIMVCNFTDFRFMCMFNASFNSFYRNYGSDFVRVNQAKYVIAFSVQNYTLHHTRDIMHVMNIKPNRLHSYHRRSRVRSDVRLKHKLSIWNAVSSTPRQYIVLLHGQSDINLHYDWYFNLYGIVLHDYTMAIFTTIIMIIKPLYICI